MSCLSVIVALVLLATGIARSQERQPVALALDGEAKRVHVANRASGSVSIIDLESRTIVSERKVGRQLSSLAWIPGTEHFLVTDEEAHELLLVNAEKTLTRLPIAESPVNVVVSQDGREAVVASLWSRRLTFVTIEGAELEVRRVIPLEFSPRELLFLDQDRLIVVADAFGGDVAVLNCTGASLQVSETIPGHNIGDLAVHGKGGALVVSHQRLHAVANTSIGDIHWGNLLGNHLRFLDLKNVNMKSWSLMRDGWLEDLGGPSNGAGDPGAMAITALGSVITCLAGAHAVEILRPTLKESMRVPVGQGPSAICLVPETNLAVVANRFSDTLTLVATHTAEAVGSIPLGHDDPMPTPAQRGEALFHDATLSLDSWMSCHSCHTHGHSSGELADTLSDGHYETPKRILSLRGVHGTEPLGWKGDVESLEEQIRNSVAKTMRGRRVLTDEETADLAAYLRALPPLPGAASTEVTRGAEVFERLDCVGCHKPPNYTTPKVYDVGLEDERGEKLFNPPSLRGVRFRKGLLHDKSASSVEDVVLRLRHQVPAGVAKTDLKALVAFLKSL